MAEDESNQRLQIIVLCLQARLGRMPTEDEVIQFIYGTSEERDAIWNTERGS